MRVLAGKRVLLTGAAAGIGQAMALELARHKAHLYLVDVDGRGLLQTANVAQSLGATVYSRRCDLTDADDTAEMASEAAQIWTGLDVLINNAGVAYYGQTHAMTDSQWHKVMSVNLQAPIQLTRELLPVLLEQPEAHILNVCSIAGLVPFRKLAAYQATKFALVGFSQALRAEYFGAGLGVTALCPGFVRTNIYDSAMRQSKSKAFPTLPNWFCATPELVARKAIGAIRANKGLVTVAPCARLAYFMQRFSPKAMELLARGRLRSKRRPIAMPAVQPQVLQPVA